MHRDSSSSSTTSSQLTPNTKQSNKAKKTRKGLLRINKEQINQKSKKNKNSSLHDSEEANLDYDEEILELELEERRCDSFCSNSEEDNSEEDDSEKDISEEDISEDDVSEDDVSEDDVSEDDVSEEDSSEEDSSEEDDSDYDEEILELELEERRQRHFMMMDPFFSDSDEDSLDQLEEIFFFRRRIRRLQLRRQKLEMKRQKKLKRLRFEKVLQRMEVYRQMLSD
jgi:hypothetical protein